MKEGSCRRPERPAQRGLWDDVATLEGLLPETEVTQRALRTGDAVVGTSDPQVHPLAGAQFDYRTLIESMNEGALVMTRSAVILYANAHFALMVEHPMSELMGRSLCDLLSPDDQATLNDLLKRPEGFRAATELRLQREGGQPLTVRVAIGPLAHSDTPNGIGMVVSDITEYRRREEILRGFARKLMQIQEVERLEMATHLGDNITQVLCSVLMRCQSLKDRLAADEKELREEADEFAELLRTTAKEVHLVATHLRPHGLDILGLASAVRGVSAEFAERMGVPIKVSCARESARLPAGAELTLYRVLQQALHNVEQHARARQVSVTLRSCELTSQLTIEDDGIGFDTAKLDAGAIQGKGFGLLNMRERASAMGGSLDVISAPGAGTKVCLSIPLSTGVRRTNSRSPGEREPTAEARTEDVEATEKTARSKRCAQPSS